MDEEPATPFDNPAADDPEIAALLNFTPVPRGVVREDGWDPEAQRGFIAALAATGNVIAAARAVARSESGAKQLRREDAVGEFADSWKRARALFHRRNPRPGGGGGSPFWGQPEPQPGAGWGGPSPAAPSQGEADAQWQMLCDSIFAKYLTKLFQEREARLAGCIVEADFYVRQLCWLEVALDLGALGDKAVEMLKGLKRGDLHAGRLVATPVSLLLDHLRRQAWARMGEPERPPPPELGLHPGEDASSGAPSESTMPGPSEAELALRAEAQVLWEAKARVDAAAWRAREGLPPLEDGEEEGEGDAAESGE